MPIRCKTCRSFRSKNPRIPCSRCNPVEAMVYPAKVETLKLKPKKSAKHHVCGKDMGACPKCHEATKPLGNPATNKCFNCGGLYNAMEWLKHKCKKQTHEDTTFTISGNHVYVYYGYKPMRTFVETDDGKRKENLAWLKSARKKCGFLENLIYNTHLNILKHSKNEGQARDEVQKTVELMLRWSHLSIANDMKPAKTVNPKGIYDAGFDLGVEAERKRIGKELKDWFYDKSGKDIMIEDAIERITGIKL